MSSLGAQLLEGPSSDANLPPRGRRWVQRAASWHGPDPSLVLTLVFALAGCSCLVEQRWRQGKGRPPAAAAPTDLAAVGTGPLPSGAEGLGQPGPVLAAFLATLVGAIICQYVSEKLAVNVVADTLQGMKQLGLRVDRRSARAWLCPTRLSLRNCVVLNPKGYRGDHLLLVRGVTADLGLWRLVRSLGTEVSVRKLCLEDVDVVLEEGGLPASGRSNVQAVLETIKDRKSQPRTRCRLHVGEVAIKNVGVQVGRERTVLADIRFNDLSAATGAVSAQGAAAALAAAVARAALDGRAQEGAAAGW